MPTLELLAQIKHLEIDNMRLEKEIKDIISKVRLIIDDYQNHYIGPYHDRQDCEDRYRDMIDEIEDYLSNV